MNDETNQLQVHTPQSIQPARELTAMEMIGALAARPEITTESVAAMERLHQLHLDVTAHAAKKSFNESFIALKRDCKPISPNRSIPTKTGIKSRFASYQEIMKDVGPLLEKHGFTETYSQAAADGNRITVTVTLIHKDGHERSSDFTCRAHTSPNNSGAQDDGGTNTLAKRYALCNMLGIVIDYDNDARNEGDTISAEDAADLEQRARAASGGDEQQMARYLRFGGAKTFQEIKTAKYEVVLEQIEQVEKAKALKADKAPAATSTQTKPTTTRTPKELFTLALAAWSGIAIADIAQAAREVAAANKIDLATANSVQFDNLRRFVEEQHADEVKYFDWSAKRK